MTKRTSLELVVWLVSILIIAVRRCNSSYVMENTSNSVILKTKLVLRQQQQQMSPSRCLNLCQNDQYCKSGQCILTECSDTVACYKYCMLCNNQLNCYQTGEFCSYNSSSSSTRSKLTNNSQIITSFLLIILVVSSIVFV